MARSEVPSRELLSPVPSGLTLQQFVKSLREDEVFRRAFDPIPEVPKHASGKIDPNKLTAEQLFEAVTKGELPPGRVTH